MLQCGASGVPFGVARENELQAQTGGPFEPDLAGRRVTNDGDFGQGLGIHRRNLDVGAHLIEFE